MASDRQRSIVGAARQRIERDGLEALTVGALAADLGIKAPSLYKHFAGKAALELALIVEGFEEFADALEAAETFGELAQGYRAFARANPQLYRLMTERPLPRDRLPEGLEARAARPVVRAMGDEHLARAAWAAAHGLVALELAGRFPPEADLDAAWEATVAAFSAAAAAAAGAPAGGGSSPG